MKKRFYYFRDKNRAPIVTVCLLADGTETARGAAVCSAKDQPCKKTGRRIALARARKAIGTKKSDRALLEHDPLTVSTKAIYNPQLSSFEERILGIEK